MQRAFQRLLIINSQDEDVRRRGYTLALMALGLMVMSLLLIPVTVQANAAYGPIVLACGIGILVVAFLLARAGRVGLGSTVVIADVLLAVLIAVYISGTPSFALFFLALALIMASLTLRPWQIWLVLAINIVSINTLLDLLPVERVRDPSIQPLVVGCLIFQAIVAVMGFLGARGLRTAMQEVQQSRTRLEASAAALVENNQVLEEQVAERTRELRTALSQVQRQLAEQNRLLAENEQQRLTIREMSVPVIPVSETTVVIPLVGALDSARLSELQGQALRAIEQNGVRSLVLDITGVVIVDSQVAQGIIGVVNAARLLGTEVLLVGIRPEVAQAIVQLGLQFGEMHTFSTLQAALRQQPARAA